jgi:hypothetical protein
VVGFLRVHAEEEVNGGNASTITDLSAAHRYTLVTDRIRKVKVRPNPTEQYE